MTTLRRRLTKESMLVFAARYPGPSSLAVGVVLLVLVSVVWRYSQDHVQEVWTGILGLVVALVVALWFIILNQNYKE